MYAIAIAAWSFSFFVLLPHITYGDNEELTQGGRGCLALILLIAAPISCGLLLGRYGITGVIDRLLEVQLLGQWFYIAGLVVLGLSTLSSFFFQITIPNEVKKWDKPSPESFPQYFWEGVGCVAAILGIIAFYLDYFD